MERSKIQIFNAGADDERHVVMAAITSENLMPSATNIMKQTQIANSKGQLPQTSNAGIESLALASLGLGGLAGALGVASLKKKR